jgi:hypothetical protein
MNTRTRAPEPVGRDEELARIDAFPSCPTFSVGEQIEAPNGALEFCFATFSEGAPGHVDATGSVTFRLAGGTIDATFHLVEIPTSDGVVQFDSGVVTGGPVRIEGRPVSGTQPDRSRSTGRRITQICTS